MTKKKEPRNINIRFNKDKDIEVVKMLNDGLSAGFNYKSFVDNALKEYTKILIDKGIVKKDN